MTSEDEEMTEAEWLACDDPQRILDFLVGRASERKLRLFAANCCRCIWAYILDSRSRTAVEIGERFADIPEDRGAVERAFEEAERAFRAIRRPLRKSRSERPIPPTLAAAICARLPAWPSQGATVASECVKQVIKVNGQKEAMHLCLILQDLFGNPFHTVAVPPADLLWNDSIVTRLAQSSYDVRDLPAGTLDNTRLLILADALEEAGCSDEQILTHLRGGGEHYRGCWVIDLLLGKR